MLSNDQQNKRLVRIANGQFVEKIETDASNEANEQVFTRLDGYLIDVSTVTTEYGKNIVLTFVDRRNEEPEQMVDLYLNENSRYVFDFFNRLPDGNPSSLITLKPYDIQEDVSQSTDIRKQFKTTKLLVLYQNANKLERYFTRDKVEALKLPAVATTNGYDFIPRLNSMIFYGCLFLRNVTGEKTKNTIKDFFDYMKQNIPGSIKHILSDLGISDTELTEIEISYNLRNNTVENPGNEQSENSDDIPF
jgi:hypothetical protein